MDSSYVEQLVKRKPSLATFCKKIAVVLLCIMAPILVVLLAYALVISYLLYIAIFIIPFSIYFGWYFLGYFNLEFEYNITNGSLEVDKIIGQRKRKRLLDINIRDITSFEKVSKNNLDEERFAKYIEASEDPSDSERYCAAFKSDKFGSTILFFSPNERTLGAMKPYLRNLMR